MVQEPNLRQAFQITKNVWLHYYMEFQGVFLTGQIEKRQALKNTKNLRTLNLTLSWNVFQTAQ